LRTRLYNVGGLSLLVVAQKILKERSFVGADNERHLGETEGTKRFGSVEDNVLKGISSKGGRASLSKYPTKGVDDV
jgi:hypothetical protein